MMNAGTTQQAKKLEKDDLDDFDLDEMDCWLINNSEFQ